MTMPSKVAEKKSAAPAAGRCSHPGEYLHNGRVAWEMPRHIGALYLCAAYLTAEGWEAVSGLGGDWEEDEDGYLVRHSVAAVKAKRKGAL